ncbi:nitrogen fixation protein NifQ [Thiohalocapsa sp. ML1]|jgi:nitrogen fixation protein NifQ|uniref:nitrogen fixation protein NifQ n=1 Tax=Thiohalocapsa sp. ML1 TaxID=1431688 RepID=UPI000A84B4C5
MDNNLTGIAGAMARQAGVSHPADLRGPVTVSAPLRPSAMAAKEALANAIFARLAGHAAGNANDEPFACMIATLCSGGGALPDWLGLEPAAFYCLLNHHFPGFRLERPPCPGRGLDRGRSEERHELVELMLLDKAGDSPSEVWMAYIVAAGCMASDHLWQDLGLWRRADLTTLMRRNFPALAARNVKDMKWKRFLYKQLCEAEGVYACRAPSCEVCTDYHACFGPED